MLSRAVAQHIEERSHHHFGGELDLEGVGHVASHRVLGRADPVALDGFGEGLRKIIGEGRSLLCHEFSDFCETANGTECLAM
jgi:hypothetical protein